MARMMTEDFIGTCQWCFGEYKVNARKTMVLHGYTRPGIGYTQGECRGVGHAPFDYAHDLTEKRILEIKEDIQKNLRNIKKIDNGEIKKIRNPSYIEDEVNRRRYSGDVGIEYYFPGDRQFDFYLKAMKASIENEVAFDIKTSEFLSNAVSNWERRNIIGLDSPATGRERYLRDAYDPDKIADAEAAAERKAVRDAKPGKVTINIFTKLPFPSREAGLDEDEWRTAINNYYAQEKEMKDRIKQWAKKTFAGKVWVGDGDDSEIRHITGQSAWSDNGGRTLVVCVKPEWQYLNQIMEMFPSAWRYDKDTNRRDPVTKQGIGKGKDIRLWVSLSDVNM